MAHLNQDQLATIAYLTGIDENGALVTENGWSWNGSTGTHSYVHGSAHKWGTPTAGSSGGTVTAAFSGSWSTAEEGIVEAALALWSDVANIGFRFVAAAASAQIVFAKAASGATATSYVASSPGLPGQTVVPTILDGNTEFNTGVYAWSQLYSFTKAAGYGVDTVVHEVSHELGLAHTGPYNGSYVSAVDQHNATDSQLYSIMSYVNPADSSARYFSQYAVTGSDWGVGSDGYARTPTTWMPLDILAVQRLYGMPTSTPLAGGQVFGFHCNVQGASKPFFDFTVNTNPVITLWDAGRGNTLDLSGFAAPSRVNLNAGSYSSCDGMTNNIAIAFDTRVDGFVGGPGSDTVTVNSDSDTITGGGGANLVILAAAGAASVTITDFAVGRDHLELSGYADDATTAALASAHDVGASTVMTLSDHSTITLLGVANASAGMFV